MLSVVPAASAFAPSSVHTAPASIVIWAKLMNCVPRPDIRPCVVADASSSVLAAVAPIVLPPFTRPENTAPGSTITRSAKPGANVTAAVVPLMMPALVTVPAPPPI